VRVVHPELGAGVITDTQKAVGGGMISRVSLHASVQFDNGGNEVVEARELALDPNGGSLGTTATVADPTEAAPAATKSPAKADGASGKGTARSKAKAKAKGGGGASARSGKGTGRKNK
jgi:hypothetical protein